MSSKIKNIDRIQKTIISFANGDFSKRLQLSQKNDDLDAILVGINMLGEELEMTTISRDYFSNIYNAVSEILIVINSDGFITDLNKTAVDILEIKKEEFINFDSRKLIQNKFKYIETDIIKAFGSGKLFHNFETELKNSSGKLIPVYCTLSKIYDGLNKHNGYLFVAKDISEQKNRALKDKKLIITTQEKERKRLSTDLHDSLIQEIAGVGMYLDSLSKMDGNAIEYKQVLESCKNILNNCIEAVRDICFDLVPQSLENGGFINACNELIIKLNKIFIIEYNFPNFDLNLSKENQTILFRIIQEFIGNSIKHSNCSKIEFKIFKKEKEIHISIKDNGKGFNINKAIRGNGLNNIISRIEALQIRHKFTSKLKTGTSLELYLDQ